MGRIGRGVVVVLVSVAGALVFTTVTGLVVLVEVPALVLFGWMFFAGEVMPLAAVSWQGVALAAVVVAVLLTAGHRTVTRFAARLTPPREWRFRDSLVTLVLGVALFVAMLGTGGLLRQAGWFLTSEEPWTELHWVRMDPFVLRNPNLVCQAIQVPPERLRGPDGRLSLAATPVGHPTLHAVPLGLDASRSAREVLLFPRDADNLDRRGGLLCRPSGAGRDEALSADDVRERLRALRRPVADTGGTGAGRGARR